MISIVGSASGAAAATATGITGTGAPAGLLDMATRTAVVLGVVPSKVAGLTPGVAGDD